MVALGQGTLRLLDRDGKAKSRPRFRGRGWTGRMRREFFGNDQIITSLQVTSTPSLLSYQFCTHSSYL